MASRRLAFRVAALVTVGALILSLLLVALCGCKKKTIDVAELGGTEGKGRLADIQLTPEQIAAAKAKADQMEKGGN